MSPRPSHEEKGRKSYTSANVGATGACEPDTGVRPFRANHMVLDGSPGVLLPGYPPGPVYQSRGETAPLATIANRKVTSCRRLSDPTL
jgi:hypothetical protein